MHALTKFDFTRILGWSVSRYDKFSSCKRQYYYDYYPKFDREYPLSRITNLRQLTSVALEAGNIVHDLFKVLLERLLRSESEINRAKLLKYAHGLTVRYCESKKFIEVYYGETDKVNTDEIFEKVKTSIENFLNSERFTWLSQKVITNKKNWLIEPPGYGETRINGMKGYCKVDFLFPMDENIFILDWKTGKPHEVKHKKQLIGYTSWASFHFDKNSKDIVPIIAYLYPTYSEKIVQCDENEINNFSQIVRDETEQMYSFCCNVEENIPLEKGVFTKTSSKIICNYCNYKELCK